MSRRYLEQCVDASFPRAEDISDRAEETASMLLAILYVRYSGESFSYMGSYSNAQLMDLMKRLASGCWAVLPGKGSSGVE